MKYRCKSVALTKLIPTNKGFMRPLCHDCKTLDCENDIEKKTVSILGINIELRLLAKRDGSYIVIACEGFINDAQSKSNN